MIDTKFSIKAIIIGPRYIIFLLRLECVVSYQHSKWLCALSAMLATFFCCGQRVRFKSSFICLSRFSQDKKEIPFKNLELSRLVWDRIVLMEGTIWMVWEVRNSIAGRPFDNIRLKNKDRNTSSLGSKRMLSSLLRPLTAWPINCLKGHAVRD